VIVENAGFGATWAAPIASLMLEKYLTDSLRSERVKEVDRISNTNLMPAWIPRVQYVADSTRAYDWFEITKDSSYIKKFLRRGKVAPIKTDSTDNSKPRQHITFKLKFDALQPDEQYWFKKKTISA